MGGALRPFSFWLRGSRAVDNALYDRSNGRNGGFNFHLFLMIGQRRKQDDDGRRCSVWSSCLSSKETKI